jgi:nitric oxide reductase large subunit
MWNIGKNLADRPAPSTFKRVMTQLLLFALLWILFTFVVIPWDAAREYPPDTFRMIGGQRAYAEIIRSSRPNYLTALRGLNMVQAKYTQEQLPGKKTVRSGNICLSFDSAGEFLSLEIVK